MQFLFTKIKSNLEFPREGRILWYSKFWLFDLVINHRFKYKMSGKLFCLLHIRIDWLIFYLFQEKKEHEKMKSKLKKNGFDFVEDTDSDGDEVETNKLPSVAAEERNDEGDVNVEDEDRAEVQDDTEERIEDVEEEKNNEDDDEECKDKEGEEDEEEEEIEEEEEEEIEEEEEEDTEEEEETIIEYEEEIVF